MDEDKKIECTLKTADGKPVLSNSIELKPDSTSPDVMKALANTTSISFSLSEETSNNLMKLTRGDAKLMQLFNDAFMYALKMLMDKPADVEDNPVKTSRVAMQDEAWIAYPAYPPKVWGEQGSGKTRREALTGLCIRLEKRRNRMCADVDIVIRNAMRLILTGKEDKSK